MIFIIFILLINVGFPKDKGKAAFDNGNYADARFYYENILRSRENDDAAKYGLGVSAYKQNDIEGALRALKESTNTGDKNLASKSYYNLANILTISRLILLPVLIILFFLEAQWGALAAWLALLVYIIAAITDFYDGYVARKLDQITPFGTFLDPISDKIFVSTMLILLVAFDRITGLWLFLPIAIFAREFLISGLREFLGPKDVKVPVTFLAKWKTATQMLSLGFLIIGPY